MLKIGRNPLRNLIAGIYRSYVSVININADTVKAIKIRPDEYEDSNSKNIRVEFIDGEKNLIKLNKSIAEISQTDDKFQLDCHDTKPDTTVIVELPITACNEIKIKVTAVKGDIKVDNIPHASKITAHTNDGLVKVMHLRSGEVSAVGSEVLLEAVYAFEIFAKAKGDEEKSMINAIGCQSDNVRLEAAKVRIDSCYSNNVHIKSTAEALLKNLHGNAKFDCSGKVFNTVGFSGTFNGRLNTERNMLHFAEVTGDNRVDIVHPSSYVRAGFANEIIKESTNLHITSNCPIQTKSKEFIVCQKAHDQYEVIRNNAESDSTLKMSVTGGKEFMLIKQSWIDSLKFDF